MNLSRGRLREIIEEEVGYVSEEEESPAELRGQMPVEELAQVVMRLVQAHPEGEEVLKQALIELYDVEVEEYEEEDPNVPVGPDADPVISPIGFRETLERLVTQLMEGAEEEGEREKVRHTQPAMQLALPFEQWVAEANALGFEFGEDSPNPYDAWLMGSTPQEYMNDGGTEDLDEVIQKKGDNYVVKSEDGKTLGTHSSRKKAQAQLYAIHKSQKEGD